MSEKQSLEISTGGAVVEALYVRREVTIYGIQESEVNDLSRWNTMSTVSFSIGAALLSYALGVWTNASFIAPGQMTPTGEVATKMIAPILCVLAVVCFGLGAWALVGRGGAWAKIKKSSKPVRD